LQPPPPPPMPSAWRGCCGAALSAIVARIRLALGRRWRSRRRGRVLVVVPTSRRQRRLRLRLRKKERIHRLLRRDARGAARRCQQRDPDTSHGGPADEDPHSQCPLAAPSSCSLGARAPGSRGRRAGCAVRSRLSSRRSWTSGHPESSPSQPAGARRSASSAVHLSPREPTSCKALRWNKG
jgi:hypothetical protein